MRVNRRVPITKMDEHGLFELNRRHDEFVEAINANIYDASTLPGVLDTMSIWASAQVSTLSADINIVEGYASCLASTMAVLNTYASTQASTLAADINIIEGYASCLASTMDVLNTYASTQASTLSANITTVAAYASNVASGVSAAGFLAGESFLTAAFSVSPGTYGTKDITFTKTYSAVPKVALAYQNLLPTDGYLAGHYTFNGSDNKVAYPAPTFLPSGNNARSVSCWYRPHNISGEKIVLWWGANTTGNTIFALSSLSNDSNGLSVWTYYQYINSSLNMTQDVLYHIVVTWDGTNLKMYADNTLVMDKTVDDYRHETITFNTGTTAFELFYNVYFGYNSGDVSDIRIFNRAITAGEASTLYALGSVASGLVFRAKCNEASGSSIDLVSANNGTISGTTTSFYNPVVVGSSRVFPSIDALSASTCTLRLMNIDATTSATGNLSGIVCP